MTTPGPARSGPAGTGPSGPAPDAGPVTPADNVAPAEDRASADNVAPADDAESVAPAEDRASADLLPGQLDAGPVTPADDVAAANDAAPAEHRPTAVHGVVVTYDPDLGDLDDLLAALVPQCAGVTVVDNGPGGADLAAVCERHGADLLPLGENTGIAHAQNVGIDHVLALGATHVLLSDQDSLPAPDMVAQLLAGIARGEAQGRGPVGAVGPVADDVRSTVEQLVYVPRRLGPRRARPADTDPDGLVDAAFLIASGCLVPARTLEVVGTMNAAWFIDHIDLEWGLRARRAGYRLLAVAQARLAHSLGDHLVKLPGRAQEIHVHSPVRTYYLTRNTILLVRSGLLPPAWALGYVIWLGKLVAFNGLLAPGRRRRWQRMMRGVVDGVVGRTGPATP